MSIWYPKQSPVQGLTGLWGGTQGALQQAAPSGGGGANPGNDSTNPAIHASQVSTWTTTNDWYWIQTTQMPSAKKVYCNLNDDGGDWMLVSFSPNCSAPNASGCMLYPNGWINGEGSATAFTGTAHMSIDIDDVWWNGSKSSNNVQCSKVMYGIHDTSVTQAPTISTFTRTNRQTYVDPNNLGVLDATAVPQSTGSSWPSPDSTIGSPGVIQWTGLKGYDSTWPLDSQGQSVAVDHTDKRWLFSTSGWWNPCQDYQCTDYGQGQGFDTGIWIQWFAGGTSIYGFGDWNYPGTGNRSTSDAASYMQWVK